MTIRLIGASHKSVPADVLEELSRGIGPAELALTRMASKSDIRECVALLTCNRVEFYLETDEPPEVVELDRIDGVYSMEGSDAVRHLFRVASGIDSAILGESEILGQVKRAAELARSRATCGGTLDLLFRHSIEVGKRVRTETSLARNPTSLPSVVVGLLRVELGQALRSSSVGVVGAGDLAMKVARCLHKASTGSITVLNRSPEAGRAAASYCEGAFRPLHDLEDVLARSDAVVSATSSPSLLIDRYMVDAAMRARRGARLVLVDAARPRNVDPRARGARDVMLTDLNDLNERAASAMASRRDEVGKVESLIERETDRFLDRLSRKALGRLQYLEGSCTPVISA